MDNLGIVVIGRNEGERLRVSLRSLPKGVPTVYVDSGSTDGSPELAAGEGAEAVRLSEDKPFSAARGRNEGFERLRAIAPDTAFVQFLDGDCELLDGWIETGLARLREDESLAAVAGQRHERYPEQSWYNELCAIEWNTPVGEARAVGGDALYRACALAEVGGFDPAMVAGEEPELCLRLRGKGYRIERLDAAMTLHDAAITTFGSWWQRAVRAGYAYALGARKHGRAGYKTKEVARSLLWGAALPGLAILALVTGIWPATLAVILLYGIKWVRLARRFRALRDPGRYAAYIMLGNVAEVVGITRFALEAARGRVRIVEYK